MQARASAAQVMPTGDRLKQSFILSLMLMSRCHNIRADHPCARRGGILVRDDRFQKYRCLCPILSCFDMVEPGRALRGPRHWRVANSDGGPQRGRVPETSFPRAGGRAPPAILRHLCRSWDGRCRDPPPAAVSPRRSSAMFQPCGARGPVPRPGLTTADGREGRCARDRSHARGRARPGSGAAGRRRRHWLRPGTGPWRPG